VHDRRAGKEHIIGKLIYSGTEVEFEDRALVHLQIVIGSKLRRGESFFPSWNDSATVGAGRTAHLGRLSPGCAVHRFRA